MSRIYHNEPLGALPLNKHSISGTWDPKPFQSGQGVLLECVVERRSRHVMMDAFERGAKSRYVVLHVRIQKAHRRKFLPSGEEVEPNFSEKGKVRTGYLHSSYATVPKGDSDFLSPDEARRVLCVKELEEYTSQQNTDRDWVPLWADEAQLDSVELDQHDIIRVKTRGDGPFIESLARIETGTSTVCNYAGGDNVGASWTDKVMAVKATTADVTQPENEGVDDDEWDD